MLPRWSRAVTYLARVLPQKNVASGRDFCAFSCRRYSKVAAAVAEAPIVADSAQKGYASTPQVNLNKMFWSKPCSLALPHDSPLRIEEPKYEGIRHIILKLMLFYSKQSKSIRGANVVYRRIVSQVDKPAIYNVFSMEKTFKTTFSLLVLHMWLYLRRLKQEGNEGVEFGQYLYEIYNHDVELRVSKAGVNLLLTRWMKDLEKIFYGNIVAYDAALLPESKQDELENVLWRNVFSDDGSSVTNDAAGLRAVQAMSRYVRRECTCLSLTGMIKKLYFLATSCSLHWRIPLLIHLGQHKRG
ncbi:Ubiquinol-cytochrome-c reductase complex assembly factor like [Actinidia chinensis var. chinensis]|uniref:Ubiquinol-cytochrome-c reductase complex assembly factor like n=1 Tax=Actinidia chinensis var. chinensis TaxID=1590841 RepID=A0A2R6PLU7_ACTCC|nr:Ubiquinol-cytochrome-c reductase complex assembly factor like [Actinidia chinensis var. chinensis]